MKEDVYCFNRFIEWREAIKVFEKTVIVKAVKKQCRVRYCQEWPGYFEVTIEMETKLIPTSSKFLEE
jgi:hypothetical protein